MGAGPRFIFTSPLKNNKIMYYEKSGALAAVAFRVLGL